MAADTLDELFRDAVRAIDAWSWIARDAGVQLALIDVLADAGATLGATPNDALANSNFAAAAHLVERGASLTLARSALS